MKEKELEKKIIKFEETIKKLKAKTALFKRKTWATNGVFDKNCLSFYSSKGNVMQDRVSFNVANKEQMIALLKMILLENTLHNQIVEQGLINDELTLGLYSYDEWISDIEYKFSVLKNKQINDKIVELEDKLKGFYTEKMKINKEMNSIEEDLTNIDDLLN